MDIYLDLIISREKFSTFLAKLQEYVKNITQMNYSNTRFTLYGILKRGVFTPFFNLIKEVYQVQRVSTYFNNWNSKNRIEIKDNMIVFFTGNSIKLPYSQIKDLKYGVWEYGYAKDKTIEEVNEWEKKDLLYLENCNIKTFSFPEWSDCDKQIIKNNKIKKIRTCIDENDFLYIFNLFYEGYLLNTEIEQFSDYQDDDEEYLEYLEYFNKVKAVQMMIRFLTYSEKEFLNDCNLYSDIFMFI